MAQMRLDDTRVVAPFSGYVAEKRLEVGASVSSQAAATSNASIAILTLQDIDPVKVQVEVPERDVRGPPGNVVRVTSDAYPGRRFSGRVAGSCTRSTAHAHDGRRGGHPEPREPAGSGMYARIDLVVEVRPTRCWCRSRCSRGPRAATGLVVRDGKVASVELGPTDGPQVQVEGPRPTPRSSSRARSWSGTAWRWAVPAKSYWS